MERKELQLVHAFRDWLQSERGVSCSGLRIPYHPEARMLRADLYVAEPKVLIEAKASAARGELRLAIGQLLDYGRLTDPHLDCARSYQRSRHRTCSVCLRRFGLVWPSTPSGFRRPCGPVFAGSKANKDDELQRSDAKKADLRDG